MLGRFLGCMSPLIRPLRSLANGLGMAWWARVETEGPDVTYWFGPFVTRRGLERELASLRTSALNSRRR